MTCESQTFSDVIFSGGTGRSGTTIIGKLLARHSQIALSKPAEIKFLTSGNGLLDLSSGKRVGRYKRLLLNDRLHLERFRYRLLHDWWERPSKSGDTAGLIQGIERERLEELCSSLKDNWKDNREIALRQFFREFVEEQKRKSGKPRWIDTTPINLVRSNEISLFLPGSRFIHMIRDGRDVISSVVHERWGPNTYEEALVWYRRRMIKILQNTTGLGDSVLTLSLEDLVINKREESIDKLLLFLDLRDERPFRHYFETEVTSEKVRRGRWMDEVEDVASFNQKYREIVAELRSINSTESLGL